MQSDKSSLKLIMIGEADTGKTTLAARLLYRSGSIDKQTIDNIDISFRTFQTEKYDFTIINPSNHRDFITSMISGASLADVAMLVVAPKTGDYEVGIAGQDRSRHHALLAFTLGIKNFIVCINKLDEKCKNYSQQIFEETKIDTSYYLKKIGYDPSSIHFIPASGWRGDNLFEKSPNFPWFKGLTLVEVLNNIALPKNIDKPLRISIQDVYKVADIGPIYCGKIETGRLKPDMSVSFGPSNIITNVKMIGIDGKEVQEAVAGDYVGFTVWADGKLYIRRGAVCGQTQNNPPKQAVVKFRAQVIVHNFPSRIVNGYCPIIKCHNAKVACKFTEITNIDRRTGSVIEESPNYIQNGDCAMATLIPTKPLCVETFDDCPSFGRFAVRDCRQTVAFGIIKSVEIRSETDRK